MPANIPHFERGKSMINRVVLVGRLTKAPELKHTQSGIAVTRFTLAVNRPFTNGNGNREADFINCVSWRKQAENVANFLNKGSLAGVDGRIQTSNFEGQDGKRVFMTEVVADSVQFLEPKNRSENRNDSQPNQNASQQYEIKSYNDSQDPFNKQGGPIEVSDDDLPF